MKPSKELAEHLRTEALPLIPCGLTIAVVVAWTATGGGYESQPVLGGGYEPDPWYLGALMIVGVLGACLLGLPAIRLGRSVKIAVGAFSLYVLWSFLSVFWAHDQGVAFHGSVRALVYLAAFLTFAILPWRSWSTRVALGMLVVGLGTLAIVTAVRLAVLTNPATLFLNARLSYPLGYYNADAAMFMTVALTAIALCAMRQTRPVLQVAGIVLSALCLQLAVLGQSRGWLFTAPVVLALTLVLVPGRMRLLAFALGPALATAAIAPNLLHVYGHATVGGVALGEPALGVVLHRESTRALHAMAIVDAVLAVLASIGVTLDRRLVRGEATQRRMGRIGAGLAILAVLAALAAGILATHGHPLARVEHAWSSFANVNNTANGSSRFTTLGSQRVDFWWVALHEFARHPFTGIGQDNFAASYLRYRKTDQEPRWTHSLELRLLTHTGLVGLCLFGLFLIAVLLAALPRRREHAAERAVAAIALLPLVVWLVHGSIDWLWEFPTLSVPALAFAGAATALGQTAKPPSLDGSTAHAPSGGEAVSRRARRSSRPAATRWIWTTLLLVSMLVAVGVPFVAARKVQRAIDLWPTRANLAYAELRSASKLLPFDDQPYLVGGAIALNLQEPAAARLWFVQARRRDDEAWVAPFALGLIDGEQGRRGLARRELMTAQTLNPGEPILAQALARLRGGHPLTFVEVQRLLSARSEQRFGR